jgi:hypothetical protein
VEQVNPNQPRLPRRTWCGRGLYPLFMNAPVMAEEMVLASSLLALLFLLPLAFKSTALCEPEVKVCICSVFVVSLSSINFWLCSTRAHFLPFDSQEYMEGYKRLSCTNFNSRATN